MKSQEKTLRRQGKSFLRLWIVLLFLGFIILFVACEKHSQKKSRIVPRAVKIYTIGQVLRTRVRRFSSVVESERVVELSFGVPGRIESLQDDLGLRVPKGEILARLEQPQYVLSLQANIASDKKAEAMLTEAKARYLANKKLLTRGYVSKIEYNKAEADYKVALHNATWANAKVSIAEDKLRKTVLIAPFDGEIAKTYVEEHQDVKAGDPIIKFQSYDKFEVTVNIPDILISQVKLNQKVEIDFITEKKLYAVGTVKEISSFSNESNVYPVVVSIINPPKSIKAGLTVEVIFKFEQGKKGYFLVPINALVPGETVGEAYLFVYDKKTSTVIKRRVVSEFVHENMVGVYGLKPGETIVVSGVRFLEDGQKVSIYKSKK